VSLLCSVRGWIIKWTVVLAHVPFTLAACHPVTGQGAGGSACWAVMRPHRKGAGQQHDQADAQAPDVRQRTIVQLRRQDLCSQRCRGLCSQGVVES
jgi:hypothetical protein